VIKDLSAVILSLESTLLDAIKSLDASGLQICLITNGASLNGTVTDGDIRRGLLSGLSLNDEVSKVMNSNPYTVNYGVDESDVLRQCSKLSIRQIPVLDEANQLVGLLTEADNRMPRIFGNSVVLMAGGRGSRLMPLTNKIPKPMLKIGESPIIEIILRRLKEQGFQKVYISINYLGDQIQNHVGDGAWLGLSVKYLREKQPLGTAGALSLLKGQIDEPVVVMNSDLLTEANLAQLLSFHIREKVEATVGVREYTVQVPFGVVELKDGKVKEIVEKPTLRSLVSAGIYVLEPSALELVPNNEFCDMPTLIARMHRDNREISAFPIHEAWLDIGRMEDLNEARNLQD